MKQDINNVSHGFERWGRSQARLPEHGDEIKRKAMQALVPGPETNLKRPNRFMLLTLTTSLLVVIFFIGSRMATPPYMPSEYEADISEIGSDNPQDPYRLSDAEEASLGGNLSGPGLTLGEIIEQIRNPSVPDTREFLKTGYRAFIRTRHVERTATHIQTMVRGYGGRIDQASIGTRYASVSFVMPKALFDQFTGELYGLVPERFLEENVHVENLLPEKQQIEKRTERAEEEAASLEDERDSAIASHKATVASLDGQINSYRYQVSAFGKEKETVTSTIRQDEIDREVAVLNSRLQLRQQELKKENDRFAALLKTYNQEIAMAEAELNSLAQENQLFLDDVDTIEGTVSIEWISVWGILNLYVPMYWWIIGAWVFGIAAFSIGRRRSFDRNLLS